MGKLALGVAFALACIWVASAGQSFAHNSQYVYDLLALGVLGLLIALAIGMHHRRQMAKINAAQYELNARVRGQRRVSLMELRTRSLFVCDCGQPMVDLKAQEDHLQHHVMLDRLQELVGRYQQPASDVPWTAVVEESEEPVAEIWHEPVSEEAS